MGTVLATVSDSAQFVVRPRGTCSIEAVVRSLLGNPSGRQHAERRREQRYPFPYPVRLVPVNAEGAESADSSVVVLGKHICAHGLDFYYTEPLPHRRVIATFERADGELLRLMMDLTWCRFGRHGWYENGGRFLQVLASDGL